MNHPYRLISPWKSKKELASYLLENIVYNDHGVIAVNKPYGVGVSNIEAIRRLREELAIRSGKYDWHNLPKPQEKSPFENRFYHSRGTPTSPYTLEDVLPILRSELGIETLDVAKSTDKFSSGIAIFAENEKIREKMKSCYKSAKISKIKPYSHLLVSTLIPELQNGYVKETVGISFRDVKFKSQVSKLPIIERKYSSNRMKRHEVTPSQVEVQVHSSNSALNAALTEIRTTVTKYHFLRIYTADMLMPVLGDHIFSNRIQRLMDVPIAVNPLSVEPGGAFQRLSYEQLKSLGMRKNEDVIVVPLHSHLAWYTLPHFFQKNKHLVISAPPPSHFRWTCTRLKLDVDAAMQKKQ